MMLHKITSPDVPMVRRNIDLDFSYILHLRGEKRKEARIDESVRRILTVKAAYELLKD